MHLSNRFVLEERYTIQETLETLDPHVILYGGRDLKAERKVRIYEFFPSPLASRAADQKTIRLTGPTSEDYKFGLRLFQEESEQLAEVSHEHIPPVLDTFDDHGTSYRIRPQSSDTTLQIALKKRTGTLSEAAAQAIFLPIIDALSVIHERDILHGGINPGTLYLTRDRKTVLTGFRGSSLRLARRLGQSVEIAIPGISPLEQYEIGAELRPATDLYCVAASIFQVITGFALPEAPVRVPYEPIRELTDRGDALSTGMRNVLLRALALNPGERVQDAAAFRDMLADPTGVPPPVYLQATTYVNGGESASQAKGITPTVDEEDSIESGARQSFKTALDNAPPPEIPSLKECHAESSSQASPESSTQRTAEEKWPDPIPVPRQSVLGKGPRTLVISAGIAAVLLAVGLLAILFGGDWLGERSNEMSQFAALTEEADSLMAERNYSAAKSRYARAKELEEANEVEVNAYLERQLEEAQQREQALKTEQFRELLNQGRSHQVNAASLVDSGLEEEALGQFESAYHAFMAAWDTRPGDSLALDLAYAALDQAEGLALQEQGIAEGAFHDGIVSNTDDRLFEYHVAEAQSHLEANHYEEAQAEFEEARSYRPDDSYVEDQLQEIMFFLSKQEREADFTSQVDAGEQFRDAGRLNEAREAFQRALSFQHSEDVERYITQIDSHMAAGEEIHQSFHAYRVRGDLLFEEERYADVASSYRQALALDPSDDHVADRLARSQHAIAQLQAEQAREDGTKREDSVHIVTDQEPQLIGTLQDLHQRVSYPRDAARSGIEGRVFMQFVVEKDGTVSQPQILRGIGGGADEEALRVIRRTAFEPALVDGSPVRAQHTLWIQFRLDSK